MRYANVSTIVKRIAFRACLFAVTPPMFRIKFYCENRKDIRVAICVQFVVKLQGNIKNFQVINTTNFLHSFENI